MVNLSQGVNTFLAYHAQKNLINTLNESGIVPSKIMSLLSKESGGDYNVGCIPVDIQNYLGDKKRKLLQDGDAQGMYKYFIESQCKNPCFFYAIKVDENGCMGNCFWVDAKSRMAYQLIGQKRIDSLWWINQLI